MHVSADIGLVNMQRVNACRRPLAQLKKVEAERLIRFDDD